LRYCFCLLLLASTLAADDRFENRLGSQAVDFIGGVQHTNLGTDPVAGLKIRGGLARHLSGYGEFTYSWLRNDVFLAGGNNGQVRASLMDFNGGLEVHASGWRLQPFAYAGIGAVRPGASLEVLGQKVEDAENKFAGSFGGGVRLWVNQYWGFSAEVKTIKPIDIDWIQRYAAGVFISWPRPR
jgi:hypothetical protein